MELTTEQEFQVRLFKDQVKLMSENAAREMLVDLYRQWLEQENRIKAGMGQHLLRGLR